MGLFIGMGVDLNPITRMVGGIAIYKRNQGGS